MNPIQPRRAFFATVAVAAAATAVLPWSGCKPSEGGAGAATGGAPGAEPIKVGEFCSLTGTEATFGVSSHEGTALAIEEINQAGGVLGRKLQLLHEDNRSTAGESVTIVKKFINRDKVVAVLGEVASGRSLEAGPVCQAAGIPMISPSSTNPKVTEVGDCVFRVCFTDPFQGRLIAEFARKSLKLSRVAVFSDVSSAYGDGLRQYFTDAFTAAGGQVVVQQKYSSKDKDFKAQLTAIKAANPEGICVPGYYNEVGLIVKQARELGITVPMFGGDGWEAPELIQIAGGEALKNTYYSTHFSPIQDTPEAKKFVAAYRTRYNGKTPDAMAALGYDSALVLADAIRRAGSAEPAKIKAALVATDLVAASGRTRMDAQRNAPKAAVIITVEDGKFKFLQTVEP